MKTLLRGTVTAQQYQEAFATEAAHRYPVVDAFEQTCGYALEPARYLEAARVLACPVKPNPPNWQHGRVLYALTRHYLASQHGDRRLYTLLDVGTAKGYSALCLQWALSDSGWAGRVVSVDVNDPDIWMRRNTVAELDGMLTLRETLRPWAADANFIIFRKSTGQAWLRAQTDRVHVAFIDGKHSYDAVREDAALLASRQYAGDVVMFDDVQMPPVARAVAELQRDYELRYLDVRPDRRYALGRRI